MSTVIESAPTRVTKWTRRRMSALRVGAVALLAGTAAVGWVTGSEASSYSQLQAGIESGAVQNIVVTGEMRGEGDIGEAVVELEWTENGRSHVAVVKQVRPAPVEVGGSQEAAELEPRVAGDFDAVAITSGWALFPYLNPNPGVTITGSVTQQLQAVAGGAPVTIESAADNRLTKVDDVALGGMLLPAWAGPILLGITAVAVGLLVWGPRPRYATRWGWFWLGWFGGWVAIPVFLLGAWPWRPEAIQDTAPGEQPREPVTGGWSFLVCLFFLGPALRYIGAWPMW